MSPTDDETPADPPSDSESDDDVREVLEATASDRRKNGLLILAGGAGALVVSWLTFWLSGPTDELGDVERILVWAIGYGGAILGVMLVAFGIALLVNSFLLVRRDS